MNERIAKRVEQDPKVAHDITTVTYMIEIHCKGNHADRERPLLHSDGTELGIYGKHIPHVCEECAELVRYAEKRRAYCPKDPKPFCSYCDTHCYAPAQRQSITEVMRYAGPRTMFSRHFPAAVKHVMDGRAAKREHEEQLREQGSTKHGPE